MKKEQKPLAPCLKCDKLIVRNTYKRICDVCRKNLINAHMWVNGNPYQLVINSGRVPTRSTLK